jgi:hypothetical protein
MIKVKINDVNDIYCLAVKVSWQYISIIVY